MINHYFSGVGFSDKEAIDRIVSVIPHRLLSCHGDYIKFGHTWCEIATSKENSKEFSTILLDSGAFTAWNQGHEVTLDGLMPVYYEFMSKYWHKVREIYLINLDKIPGSPGRTPDSAEIDECIKISDRNYERLVKEFGERVLPVYHQGESESRLREVVAMTKYICVSPRNDLHEGERVKWSKEVHCKIPKTTKTHGLATTGMEMMTKVRWTSVDSASWISRASRGRFMVCVGGKLRDIAISERSPFRHERGNHVDNVDPLTREAIIAKIEMRGFDYEELRAENTARCLFTIMETQEWVDNHHKFVGKSDEQFLFDL